MSRENTFGGGPPACRVALECLAILEEENLLENVASVGAYLQQELKRVTETHAAAKEVRGRGFIQGSCSTSRHDPSSNTRLPSVLFNSSQDTVLRFLPPFLLQEKHVDKGCACSRNYWGRSDGRLE